MTDASKDAGVIAMLLQRFEVHILPRGLAMEKKVDGGACLDDYELALLERVLADAHEVMTLLARHPEYEKLAARAFQLYKDILSKSLENETNRQ